MTDPIVPSGEARGLSPLEGVVDLVDRARSLNFVVIADIAGPLSDDSLRDALDTAQRRHPLLAVRIDGSGPRAHFRSDGVGPIPLELIDDEACNWASHAEHEMNAPLPRATGPLVRCTRLRRGPDQTTLMLTFNHTIGDGSSGAYLLRDILEAVAGRPARPALPLPAPTESRLPESARGLGGLIRLMRFFAREFLGYARAASLPRRVQVEAQTPLSQVRGAFVHREMQPDLLTALVDRCRREKTSVHGALNAAMMQTYLQLENSAKPGFLVMGSPVNMRNRMQPPVGDDIGLFVSIAQSAHRVRPSTEFWALARDARHALARSIEAEDPFCLAPVASWIVARLAGFLSGPAGPGRVAALVSRLINATTGITNLGVLEIDEVYGPLSIERIQFVVSPSAMANFVTTAATHRGRLSWNFVFNEPRVSRTRVEAFADHAMSLIGRVVQ